MVMFEAKNKYTNVIIEGKQYIKFYTGGKHSYEVIVNIQTWENYLHKYHWTALKNKSGYLTVKTSINKHSVRLHRMIIENEYDEIDYWGNIIDHINNNPLDNRLENLRIYHNKLNSTNIKSKNLENGTNFIFPQKEKNKDGTEYIYGYKIHKNIFDETIYKNFPTLEEAQDYRDTILIPYINKRIDELTKKARDIEFERGLRNKIRSNELNEIIEILNKYGISVTTKLLTSERID